MRSIPPKKCVLPTSLTGGGLRRKFKRGDKTVTFSFVRVAGRYEDLVEGARRVVEVEIVGMGEIVKAGKFARNYLARCGAQAHGALLGGGDRENPEDRNIEPSRFGFPLTIRHVGFYLFLKRTESRCRSVCLEVEMGQVLALWPPGVHECKEGIGANARLIEPEPVPPGKYGSR